MTSLPPPSMPRPSGIAGMQPSAAPGRPGVFRSGIGAGLTSSDTGYNQNTQVTNETVNTKLAVRFLRSTDETQRTLGAGQLIYARAIKMTATGSSMSGPAASVSLVDPMSVSGLNEWLRQPAQRRRFGSSKAYPSEFKFQGVQATHTDRGRSGFQGSWGELVLVVTASGVFHELPNIGMAHRVTKKGDKVYGVWLRMEYKETDFTKSYEDEMAERKLPRWDPVGEQLGLHVDMRGEEDAALDQLVRQINQAKTDYKAMPPGDVARPAALAELNKLIAERDKFIGRQRSFDRFVDGLEAARDKAIPDEESLSDSHYWQVVPYVSESGEAPPEALYITNKCIGHVDAWYEVMTMRPMASSSKLSVQARCKKALIPCGGGDDWIKALVGIPHCEAMICRS